MRIYLLFFIIAISHILTALVPTNPHFDTWIMVDRQEERKRNDEHKLIQIYIYSAISDWFKT